MRGTASRKLPDQNIDRFRAAIVTDMERDALDLPTLPDIALKILEVVDDEESDVADIAKLLRLDPALSARLLRIANSALYRGSVPIEHLVSGIARLGSKAVRNLVSSLVVLQLFRARSPMLKLRMKKLSSHSIEVAATAYVLARRFTRLDADEAMLAGLLHDIGVLPILSYAERSPDVANDTQTLEQVIDALHTSIGGRVLEAWGFRPELVSVAADHEDLQRHSPEPDYVDVVQIANLHSKAALQDQLAEANWNEVPAFRRLGLTPDGCLSVMAEADAEIAEIKNLLQG